MSDKAAKEKKKGGKTTLLAIVAVILLGGGGGGAYWWFSQQAAEASEHDEAEYVDAGGDGETEGAPTTKRAKKRRKPEAAGLIEFEPFVVNLADKDASRFVKATVSLAVSDAKIGAALEHNPVTKPRMRSVILEILSRRTAGDVTTPEGKDELKAEIAEAAQEILHDAEVVDVLFTEFIVQF